MNLFEVTGTEDSVRDQLDRADRHDADASPLGHDFRTDVEQWLDAALRRRSITASPEP